MTVITNKFNVFSGTSDCGRIVYHELANGFVTIDGRLAWRGTYKLDIPGRLGMTDDGRVSPADWELAVSVMRDVDAAKEAHHAASRARVEASQRRKDDFYDGLFAAIASKQIIVD